MWGKELNNTAPAVTPTLYAMAFFDVQNLYRHAWEAFGGDYHHPNFDPKKLHHKVAEHFGFEPSLTRFYTGVPVISENEMWAGYWSNRVLALKRAGVYVETRKLRYHVEEFDDGTTATIAQEKGIDIRIALDLVKCARKKEFDVAIIFSQDQDLGEVVPEIRDIAKEQGRAIRLISAFPENALFPRGIDKTEWFRFDKSFYDACLDPKDYRPVKFQGKVI